MMQKIATFQRLFLSLTAIGGLLAACTTGPEYKPRGEGERIGYTDERLSSNRFRVTFSGGTRTERAQVEDYLLRRAAEVTLQSGFTHFVFDQRDTEAKTYYRAAFDTYSLGWDWRRYGRYRPSYWSNWDYGRADAVPVTRYSAYAEIVMLTAAEAARNPRSIPADEVLRRLASPAPVS
jgi:hypothetical protein